MPIDIDKITQCTNCYIKLILLNTYIAVKETCKPSETISISLPFMLASPDTGGGNVGGTFNKVNKTISTP